MLVALLPLKGNSERVPQKNIRSLNGKPLFFFVADNIKKTKLFDKLVINTDSAEIEKMAMVRYGDWVNINKRPADLQGDMISMNRIIEYDVKSMGIRHDYMQTHSTSPFLSPKTIASAVTEYREQKKAGSLDSLFSVSEIHSRLYSKDLCPINHDPNVLARTQDLEVVYEENVILGGRRGEPGRTCGDEISLCLSNNFSAMQILTRVCNFFKFFCRSS